MRCYTTIGTEGALPWKLATGRRPNIAHLRTFGREALAYVENDKRKKFNPKTQKCTYLGVSPLHSRDTYTLYNLRTKKTMYRRNVTFNEKSFPARCNQEDMSDVSASPPSPPPSPPPNEEPKYSPHELDGKTFEDDGDIFTIIGVGTTKPITVVLRIRPHGGGILFQIVGS